MGCRGDRPLPLSATTLLGTTDHTASRPLPLPTLCQVPPPGSPHLKSSSRGSLPEPSSEYPSSSREATRPGEGCVRSSRTGRASSLCVAPCHMGGGAFPPSDGSSPLTSRRGLAGSPSHCSVNASRWIHPPALPEEGRRCGSGGLPSQAPSSGNARGQGHSRDTRTLPPIHLQGCRAPVGTPATLGVGLALCPGARHASHLFSTVGAPRVPEAQACPPNRELSATSCVSKPQGPQEHRPTLAWSYTPAMPVPSQKPLGVTLAWGQRLVSSPEMPWAGDFPGLGAQANLGQGGSPSRVAQGRWGLTQLVHLVSECRCQPREAAAGPSLPLGQGSLPA